MAEDSLEQQIAHFIRDNFLFSEYGITLDSDTSFMETEILDSTGILQLVLFLEQTYGITVDGHEITPDNLDSVRRVSDYLQHKRGLAS